MLPRWRSEQKGEQSCRCSNQSVAADLGFKVVAIAMWFFHPEKTKRYCRLHKWELLVYTQPTAPGAVSPSRRQSDPLLLSVPVSDM
jgi:hypothetical protein